MKDLQVSLKNFMNINNIVESNNISTFNQSDEELVLRRVKESPLHLKLNTVRREVLTNA